MNATGQTATLSEPTFAPMTLTSQSVFRILLDTMARPGVIGTLPHSSQSIPAPMDPATAAIVTCLFDHDTQIWLGDGIACVDVYDYLKLHCSCPLIKSGLTADFSVLNANDGVPGLAQFDSGTDAYPDRSTTLIIQVPDIDTGPSITLTGPGVEPGTEASLAVAGIPDYFWQERRDQQEFFPCGLDLIFTSGDRFVALPRSTEIEV